LKAAAAAAFYGPSDWLVENTTARDRRAFGFWNIVTRLLDPAVRRAVLFVVLSIVALFPNVTSETPVEEER
jgi:hypothetical protein